MRRRILVPTLFVLAASAVASCGSPDDTPVGAVRVTVTTEGSLPDPDGYTLVVGEQDPVQIGANGELMIPDLAVGQYPARLEGLAANCWVSGANPLTVQVEPNVVTIAAFVVSCPAAAGRVRIVTTTSGQDPDEDGYLVTIGPGPAQAVPANGAYIVGSGALGTQPVTVQGIAAHCTASPSNPTTVEVLQRPGPDVTLAFACTPITGAIAMSLTAVGEDIRANGLSVALNNATHPIVIGSPVTVAKLSPATYGVELVGTLAPNCEAYDGTGRQAVVTAGDTTRVTFTLRCTEAQDPVVRVTAITTGPSPDPNGYQVTIYQDYWYYGWDTTFTSPANGTTEVKFIPPGNYGLSVSGASPNCRIQSPLPYFSVGTADVDVSFTVDCVATRQLAYTARGGSASDIHIYTTNGTVTVIPAAGADSNPAWARSGTELALTSTRDGNPDIYRMNPDGSGAVRLTTEFAADYRPAWSPDGSRIAFVSERDGNPEIYVMSRDGTGLVRLTNNLAIDTEPAWSPDGTRLAFVSNRDGGAMQLYLMNADGSNVVRRSATTTDDRTPAWSPDGRLIAFSRLVNGGHQPYVMDATGAQPRSLSTVFSSTPVNPDWSPDGFQVAFSSAWCDFYYGCSSGLYILDLTGLGLTLLPISDPEVSDPSWRP